MNEKNDSLRIDLEKVIRDKNPRLAKTLPRFVIAYLKRIIHQDEINRILTAYAHLDSIPFIRAAFVDMGISYQAVGIERLADDGRYLFVSNHPFGGMDGLMLCDEIYKRFGKVHIIVNDLLMYLTPLKSLFIPINKHGRQKAEYVQMLKTQLDDSGPIATFPAGLCSRRIKGVVQDLAWKPSFIKNAISSGRDIVPVFFEGKLSSFFYNLANLRTFLGIKANIEMLYLADEMFKQKGKHFNIRFGTPIPCDRLKEFPSTKEASDFVRDAVYRMKQEK